jgi:hypothetical protein
MCSWIHKKGAAPPVAFHHFESKRAVKGIVYYADRHRELRANPALALHSPHKVVKVEQEQSVAVTSCAYGAAGVCTTVNTAQSVGTCGVGNGALLHDIKQEVKVVQAVTAHGDVAVQVTRKRRVASAKGVKTVTGAIAEAVEMQDASVPEDSPQSAKKMTRRR